MHSLAHWLGRQQQSHPSAIDLDLARVGEVARRLGLLTPDYRVITVGGTNGKGSTVAFLDGLIRAAGRRCGRFTSPHLTRYNERICVDGVEAGDEDLIACFERIDAARGAITLTFFEYNALAALNHFRRCDVEFAVLEVGLGGRLDATNIIDADVGVVCSIGLDHMDWLGSTLAEIAREKAGIFRKGRPAVLGSAAMPPAMFESIRDIGALPCIAGRDFQSRSRAQDWDFDCGTLHLRNLPVPALTGVHQMGNAATALAALAVGNLGITLNATTANRALRDVRISGRFQIVPGEVEWILDVAHNVPAAQVLKSNLQSLSKRRTLAVCGILGDKDIAGIAATLRSDIDVWILASLEGPRALSTNDLAARIPGATIAAQTTDVASACRAAHDLAKPGDRVLVFGSFLTVGPALEFLGI